ncbi:MAG: DUF4974 domain-containing protein [Odoribacter sp.]
MMKYYQYIREIARLIFAQMMGRIGEDERYKLEDWKNASPENEKLYAKYVSEKFVADKFRFIQENNTEEAYREFSKSVDALIRHRRIYCFCRYAAFALLLIGLGILFYPDSVQQKQDIPLISDINPGSCKAILTLSDGKQVHISDTTYSVYTELETENKKNDSLRYHTITIPRGGEYFFTLSDGSRIWMNSESEVRFPLQFCGGHREISMSGEVFFQIARDTSSPFLIHTRQGDIRVLGTSFNVRDYANEPLLTTTLVSGKVAFNKSDGKFILSPGEQLQMNRQSGDVTVAAVNTRLYCSWKDGRFVFEKQRLEEIMLSIERWYDIQVIYEDENLKNLLFSGNIKRYDKLEPLLEMLKLVNKVDIVATGNQIAIRYNKENR